MPGWAEGIAWLLRALLAVAVLVAIGYLLVRFGVVLGSPFYGQLSERLETSLTGAAPPAEPLSAAYTDDPAVRAVVLGLLGYVAFYQIFDAWQTIAAHALRGYRITLAPMFVHVFCFWGVGLFGGWWLAFHVRQPMGVAAFWLAPVLSLVLAALLLGALLWRAMRALRE